MLAQSRWAVAVSAIVRAVTSTALAPSTAHLLVAEAAAAQRVGRLPSLVAGIVREGVLAWSDGFGRVDGVEPDTDVQYRLGSITKTVTTVALLRLRDEGRCDLDDPIERHLPGTPFGDRTLGQLLAHDAGLRAESPGQWWERTPGTTWPDLAARFSRAEEVRHGAGRRFHYSNLGFAAAGEVVARLRGRPWADVVRDEVLLPLGMRRTTTRPDGRAARGWAVHPWADVLQPEPEHDAGAMAPAGQLWATLVDLGRWAVFLLGDTGDVLATASLKEMREPAGVEGSAAGWSAYGLGLQISRSGETTYVGHGGSMPGFLAGVTVDVEQGVGAVVLANATSGLDAGLTQRLLETVRRHEPRIVDPWLPLVAPDDGAMRLVGTWYWGTSPFGLRLRADGLLELIPLLGAAPSVRFRRDDAGGWVGLEGYYHGERLQPVEVDGRVVALNIGTFIHTRSPYDADADVPGGTDPDGWRPGTT